MPYCKTRTETVVAVTVSIVVVEVEHSCIRSIVVVAPTFEERVVRIHKVGVIVDRYIPAFCSSSARTKSAYYLTFTVSIECICHVFALLR